MKKLDVNKYGFAHLTFILLLHYFVKCRSRCLAVYNNKFVLGSACIGSSCISHCFKMAFTADDKQFINSLRQLKGYSSQSVLKEFLQKNLTYRGLDYLLANIDEYGTAETVPSIGQEHTVCMCGNTISKLIRLKCNT